MKDKQMDPKKTCYLFLDFDETVFVGGTIPQENKKALRAVQQLGHQLILNTGRSRGGLDFSNEKHQGVDWDGYIFGAGDMEYRGQWIHEHHLSPEACMAWIKYAMERHYWVHLQSEHTNRWDRFDEHPQPRTEPEKTELLQEIADYLQDNPITKLTIRHVDEADLERFSDQHIIQMERYTEIFPQGRHKGTAFLEFCEYFDIPQEQCICFGDSLNDLEIFKVCPNSVCMKKGAEELKAIATYTATEQYGVAEGIAHYFGV